MSNKYHILLIDDDSTVNMLNRVVIEKSDLDALISNVTYAKDALDQIESGALSPSLILLDLNMPQMDGWQFIEHFQKLPSEKRNTKIVILSSSINPLDKERASRIPEVTDFMSKPLSIEKVDELKELLETS